MDSDCFHAIAADGIKRDAQDRRRHHRGSQRRGHRPKFNYGALGTNVRPLTGIKQPRSDGSRGIQAHSRGIAGLGCQNDVN